ncbi:MAG TPA: hypothetical protein PL131_11110 [Methylotenera sp.]|nr:hypothetical protein [Methylotenera sp.]HPH06415.1 hypothetical protein [Methylotenera sp.]HPN00438.1 hypothetical protein [Methylotenera sp.]
MQTRWYGFNISAWHGCLGRNFENEKFDVAGHIHSFLEADVSILACGNLLKIRQSERSDICPILSMQDLYAMINHSDKLLSY